MDCICKEKIFKRLLVPHKYAINPMFTQCDRVAISASTIPCERKLQYGQERPILMFQR